MSGSLKPRPFHETILEEIASIPDDASPQEKHAALDGIRDKLLERQKISGNHDEILEAYRKKKGITNWDGEDGLLFLRLHRERIFTDIREIGMRPGKITKPQPD